MPWHPCRDWHALPSQCRLRSCLLDPGQRDDSSAPESDGSLRGPTGRLLGTNSSLKSLRSAVKRRMSTRDRQGVQRTASKGYLIHRWPPLHAGHMRMCTLCHACASVLLAYWDHPRERPCVTASQRTMEGIASSPRQDHLDRSPPVR